MKKLLLFVALAFMFQINAQAQFDIKLDPASSAFGTGDISLEYIFNGRVGIEIGGGPKYGKLSLLDIDVLKRSGIRGFFLAQYYFSKEEKGEGFAMGLYAKIKEVTYSDTFDSDGFDDTFTWKRNGIGLNLSYKAVFDGGFLFGFNVGLGGALKNEFFDKDGLVLIDQDLLNILGGDVLLRMVVGYRLAGK